MARAGQDAPPAAPAPPGAIRARMSPRVAALVAGTLLIGLHLSLPDGGFAHPVVITALAAAATASALSAGRRTSGAVRTAWLALAAGMLLSAVADAGSAGTVPMSHHAAHFPSWADVVMLISAPCFAVALATVMLMRRGVDRVGDLLDALIIVIGGGSLLTCFALVPAAEHSPGSPVAHLIATLYPATDLLLLALLVPVAMSHRLSRPLRLVGASFVALLAGDTLQVIGTIRGGPAVGELPHALWMASYLLIAAAPLGSGPAELVPEPVATRNRMTNGRWVLLGGALLAGPILLADPIHPAVGVGVSAAILGLVVLRLAHLNRGLARVSQDVQDKSEQLRHQATHDALTGLPNRALITERIDWMLHRSRRPGSSCAALLVDLDGFKHVNDSRGHDVGDELLVAVARRLTTALREVDSIGRIGGDEFAVLIDEVADDCAPELVASRIVDVLRHPFDLGTSGAPVSITVTIGIAVGSRDGRGDLLRGADVALNQAKAAGKNCYEVFQPEMETSVQRRYEIEIDLHTALARDEFELKYQPIYDLDDLSLVGLEALLRWNHPQHGQLAPADFLPVLESSGLIVEVGRWVLLTASRHMAAWRAHGTELMVSVNVSPKQLDGEALVEHVQEALTESGLTPSALTIEVTETALMRNVPETAHRLHELKALGIQVAIDDFGTGYSSLAYLRQFPVDCLKIDRTFTDALSRSRESDALIHTLVQLGKDLGLRTLAEGVETPAQMARLRRENVHAVQGFLLAEPMTAAAVDAELAQRRSQRVTTAAGDA